MRSPMHFAAGLLFSLLLMMAQATAQPTLDASAEDAAGRRGTAEAEAEAAPAAASAADDGAAQLISQARKLLAEAQTREEVAQAFGLLNQAGRAGSAEAMFELCRLYSNGKYRRPDYDKSLRLARMGAERGYAKSMVMVAVHYANGWGAEKDLAQTRLWMQKAADLQEAYAIKWLKDRGFWEEPVNVAPEQPGEPTARAGEEPAQPAPRKVVEAPPEVMPSLPETAQPTADAGDGSQQSAPPGDLTPLLKVGMMTGDRPGGEVLATKALLSVLAGGLDSDQKKAVDKQYAADYADPSPATASRHRRHNENLGQALIEREIMFRSARQQDAALQEVQIAQLLGDLDEQDINQKMADLQVMVMQDSARRLEKLAADAEQEEANAPPPERLEMKLTGSQSYKEACQAALAVQKANLDSATYKGLLGKWVQESIEKSRRWPDDEKTKLAYGETWAEYWFVAEKKGLKPSQMHFKAWWDRPPAKINVYDTFVAKQFRLPMVDDTVDVNIGVSDAGSQVSSDMLAPGTVGAGLNWSLVFNPNWYVGKTGYMSRQYFSEVIAQIHGSKDPTLHFPVAQKLASWGPGEPKTEQWPDGKYHVAAEQRMVLEFRPGWASVKYVYKWVPEPDAPVSLGELPEFTVDDDMDEQMRQAVQEHVQNINFSMRAIQQFRRDLDAETNLDRQDQLRFQILHAEQDIHDAKDLIESVKTGTIVHTRGPWDDHAEATAAQASVRLAQEIDRAQQMQASALRMAKVLEKYSPEEAKKAYDLIHGSISKGVFASGGMQRAQDALNAIHGVAKAYSLKEYATLQKRQDYASGHLGMVETHLAILESVKRNADRAIFVGTLFTPMGPGMALAIGYEGICTGAEKGPVAAIKQTAKTALVMAALCGVMKAGEAVITKFLNPKVAAGVDDVFAAAKYQEELVMNKALVNRVKETQAALDKARQAGKTAEELAKLEAVATDAVSAANSSTLAKRILKNELFQAQEGVRVAQKQMQIVAKNPEALKAAQSAQVQAAQKLREVEQTHAAFQETLGGIYSKVDDAMVSKMQNMGYNVDKNWFMEFRNATSKGINCDRDLGLLAARELQLLQKGKPVKLETFMKDCQKVYEKEYRTFNNGRSAKLADQNITTSVHSESFPLEFLDATKVGTASADTYRKAGSAICNKVSNAMAGSDPAMVNLQKAYASLSKDLKTKVNNRLANARPQGIMNRNALDRAGNQWDEIAHVMDDFAKGRIDPIEATRKVREFSGGKTMTQIAGDAKKLMTALGGA